MQALLNLTNPSFQLQSLQGFYDTLETHIRGLNSLGKSEDSYGALLVPIVQGKLPSELKKALAREHNDTDWTISELRAAILKEIKILEADVHVNLSNLFDKAFPPSTTMQLHTSSPKSPQSFSNQIVKKRSACVFCKAYHPSSDCNKVTDPKKRFELVKAAKLCFNFLGYHKVSACTLKGHCKNCRCKHHTSLSKS